MGDLSEMLRDGYAAHERALGVSAGTGLAGRAVRDVRTRRAWRAGATGAVAAVSVGAVAAGAWAWGGEPQQPASSPAVMTDLTSLGECAAYMPANPDVMPDSYAGRAYVDAASGFVVAVTRDGLVTRVLPDDEGNYVAQLDAHSVTALDPALSLPFPVIMDFSDSGGGGAEWVDAGLQSYRWTKVDTGEAPAGVNVQSLWRTVALSLGVGGEGYAPSAVPAGARTDFFATYTDGTEDTGLMIKDHPTPNPDEELDLDRLSAIGLRVTLADGATWELRFAYTPENVPELPCQPTPPSGAAATPEPPAPSADALDGTGVSQAPEPGTAEVRPLEGPESRVFTCGAPLPADLEDSTSATASRVVGTVRFDVDEIDLGADGLLIETTAGMWPVSQEVLTEASAMAGWQGYGQSVEGEDLTGGVRYEQIVALRDGLIVGYASEPIDDWTANGVGELFSTSGARNGVEEVLSGYNGIGSLMVPCDAASGDDLAGTSLALLYGSGPTLDDVAFAWTAVQE